MLMGRFLLENLEISLSQLDHRKFNNAKSIFDDNQEAYYQRAVEMIGDAIPRLYGNQQVSLQRLAATFRRGDLLEELSRGNQTDE